MTDPRPVLHIASAIIRRDDEIVMIRQAAPDEEPFWSVPSGRVEDGELVTEGSRARSWRRRVFGSSSLDGWHLSSRSTTGALSSFTEAVVQETDTWRLFGLSRSTHGMATSSLAIRTVSWWTRASCLVPTRSRTSRSSSGSPSRSATFGARSKWGRYIFNAGTRRRKRRDLRLTTEVTACNLARWNPSNSR